MLRLSMLVPLAATMWLPAVGGAAARPRPPNVLILMTDQHNHGVLGCAGNSVVRTPHLDQLAEQGARFTRAVCSTPFCSPTRASIITGRWPHSHGIVANVRGADRKRITDRDATLETLLFDRGYRTGHFGKWHLGTRTDLRCYRDRASAGQERAEYREWLERHRDSYVKLRARPGERFIAGLFMVEPIARAHAVWKRQRRRSRQDLSRIGRSPVAAEAQFEYWLADRAIRWLEQNGDRPFLLTFSVSPPHAFWTAPAPYYDEYDPRRMPLPASVNDRPAPYQGSQPARLGRLLGADGLREYLRCYYAQVTMMDHVLGRILDKLDQLGLTERTLVIFTSDHGDMQAAHGMVGKSLPAFYDEIVRVPLIVRYPPSIRAGQVIDMHAGSVDLLPTILDYVGVPVPAGVQGISLRPVLDGRAAADDRPAYCERGLAGPRACRMIRTRGWKYAVFGNRRRELFDLTRDPGELHNLADQPQYRQQQQQLDRELRQWMQCTGDPALPGWQ